MSRPSPPPEVLAAWSALHDLAIGPAPDPGLINDTWVLGRPPAFVLQRIASSFSPRIHLDIEAVTRRLAAAGEPTTCLVQADDGRLWIERHGSCWRVLTFVPGRTLHRLPNADLATEAGALVGRFHRAIAGLGGFSAPPRRAHDTVARMARLRRALVERSGETVAPRARGLADAIFGDWEAWSGCLELPDRPGHGDLKVSNLRFSEDGERGVCILDLDTVGPLPVAEEMGDAWRSWCNPAAEDDLEATDFRFDLFAASARAWLRQGPRLTSIELEALVPTIERICLELASRFTTDALERSVFREDLDRFGPGEHNLLRAEGQLRLARLARDAAPRCRDALREIAAGLA